MNIDPSSHLRSAGWSTTSADPASHLLEQAHLLLRAAHAIHAGRHPHAPPRPLDHAQRGRLAAWLAAITGCAGRYVCPANLPTGQPDPPLAGKLGHAAVRLRQARTHLDTLAILAEPGRPHDVLALAADVASAMEWAWMLTQAAGGYQHRRQVAKTCAQLGHVVRGLADIAQTAGEHGPDQRWQPAAGLLVTASHALHAIHAQVGFRP